ncbi:MAG: PH domain-containing protein [Planctomycetaceae bacterium]|nr:PH domain-containing protein [Planctomycetaceae bacterium]
MADAHEQTILLRTQPQVGIRAPVICWLSVLLLPILVGLAFWWWGERPIRRRCQQQTLTLTDRAVVYLDEGDPAADCHIPYTTIAGVRLRRTWLGYWFNVGGIEITRGGDSTPSLVVMDLPQIGEVKKILDSEVRRASRLKSR